MGPDHFVISLLATLLSLGKRLLVVDPATRLLAYLFIYILVACIAILFSKAFNHRRVRNSQKQLCSENKW